MEQKGFRLPLPLCANDGRWVVDGWCAQTAADGEHPKDGRWGDVISTGDRFHKAIRHLSRPAFLDDRIDPWTFGDRVAWQEVEPPKGHKALSQLLEMRRPIASCSQLIHGDLTENVLFAEGQPPAVIDVSPYWRPVGFAAAVVVADAVCWRHADPETLFNYISDVEEFLQLLIRALIYRMVTTISVAKGAVDLSGYAPGVNLAMRVAS